MALGLSLFSGVSTESGWPGSVQTDEEQTVIVEIQFGDKRENKTIPEITFTDKMTVLDAMVIAKKSEKLKFSYRGKGATAFLTEIDGVKNQGSRGDNWIFRVNGKLGKKSFGATTVRAGDKITWTFGKYKP